MVNLFSMEELSMEELDRVTGGTMSETRDDTSFLKSIGLNVKERSTGYINRNFDAVADDLRSAWLQVGVFCKTISTSNYQSNVYTDLKGNPLSREEAMQIARSAQGIK